MKRVFGRQVPSFTGTNGSLILAINDALETTRIGSRDDESLALEANNVVRRILDKRAITYREYKSWRKHNPSIFTALVSPNNELIGFFDVFPLTTQGGELLSSGHLNEHEMSIAHILPAESTSTATHVHIATILVNPRQRTYSPLVANEVLLLRMGEFLEETFSPLHERRYTAYGQTPAGVALLRRSGFVVTLQAKEDGQRLPLYSLTPSEVAKAIFRMDRSSELLARRGAIKQLDSRIARIETEVRRLISFSLAHDGNLLPPHVRQKIDERIATEARKSAAFDMARYAALLPRLEFCDLRELQDVLLAKTLWQIFEGKFGNRETLASKFAQFAGLRNTLRHTRHLDEITRMEGEASLLWFEKVLSVPP